MSLSTFGQLSAEHRCLLELAENLDQQAAALVREALPDLQTMLDDARGLRAFYTRAHGPKDDAVVAKALEHAGEVLPLMTPFLRTDADRFLHRLLALETALQAAMRGQAVATRTIAGHARDCLRTLRAQIKMEESATYPWAHRRLGSRGRRELARELALISERWPHDPCAQPSTMVSSLHRPPKAGAQCTCAA